MRLLRASLVALSTRDRAHGPATNRACFSAHSRPRRVPRPFVWPKSAGEILDTMARYHALICDSAHEVRLSHPIPSHTIGRGGRGRLPLAVIHLRRPFDTCGAVRQGPLTYQHRESRK